MAYSVTPKTKMIPSAPAEKTNLPSGDERILTTSPAWALKLSNTYSGVNRGGNPNTLRLPVDVPNIKF